MQKTDLTWADVNERAHRVAVCIAQESRGGSLYGVPRGGTFAALLVSRYLSAMISGVGLVSDPREANAIIDDVVDSGETKVRHLFNYERSFYSLYDKQRDDAQLGWIKFPWETDEQEGPTDNITRLIQFIGDDPNREGLRDTPSRVIKSYSELFSGYKQDSASVFKTFEDGACDEMVLLKNIEFCSSCEHHLLPFFGSAHIAYVPKGKVIGVSKLARLLEVYSRRLQIQERISQQVTKALDDHLQPLGSACILQATHLCMVCRGVQKQHSELVTSSLTGVFREKPEARQELFSLIKG